METKLANIDVEDLKLVPTKQQVQNATDSIVAIVEEGLIDPLQALATVTAMEKAFADAKKRLTEASVTEAMKYPDKTINIYGAQFQLKETGVKYDFSDDSEWRDLKANLDELQALIKGREETLKRLGLCSRTSTTTVSVTLGK